MPADNYEYEYSSELRKAFRKYKNKLKDWSVEIRAADEKGDMEAAVAIFEKPYHEHEIGTLTCGDVRALRKAAMSVGASAAATGHAKVDGKTVTLVSRADARYEGASSVALFIDGAPKMNCTTRLAGGAEKCDSIMGLILKSFINGEILPDASKEDYLKLRDAKVQEMGGRAAPEKVDGSDEDSKDEDSKDEESKDEDSKKEDSKDDDSKGDGGNNSDENSNDDDGSSYDSDNS